MQIKLDLHIDAVNAVLTALSKMPYEYSAPLINEIQKQAGPQVETKEQGQMNLPFDEPVAD